MRRIRRGRGLTEHRPKPETAWPRVFLAGDYDGNGLAGDHGRSGSQRIPGGGSAGRGQAGIASGEIFGP